VELLKKHNAGTKRTYAYDKKNFVQRYFDCIGIGFLKPDFGEFLLTKFTPFYRGGGYRNGGRTKTGDSPTEGHSLESRREKQNS
jgi:hypothetical protein